MKKGFSGSVSNYHPISLTSVVSRILEHILTRSITVFVLQNNILYDGQHGFLQRRSPCTNLLESLNDWTLNVELGYQTVIVYVDFAKAYDTVSHNKLISKLHLYGIRGSLLLWIKSFFFSERSHQTKVNGIVSDPTELLSDVVQGSGIGPIMFIVFTNDLIDVLEHYGVTCELFADDLKLYLRVNNPCDIVNLQLALDAYADWEKCWQLSVSPSKCCVMCISAGEDSRVGNSPCLHISDTQLPVVNSNLDLGITIANDLSPCDHTKNIVAKAHMRANAIHRCFVSKDKNGIFYALIPRLCKTNSGI